MPSIWLKWRRQPRCLKVQQTRDCSKSSDIWGGHWRGHHHNIPSYAFGGTGAEVIFGSVGAEGVIGMLGAVEVTGATCGTGATVVLGAIDA